MLSKARWTMLGLCFAMATPVSAIPEASAGDALLYDFSGPYLRRMDGITPGAGNAKDFNAALHVIDPWPRYSGNRNIPANGERMVGAIERYRDVRKLPLAPLPLAPILIEPSGLSGGGGAAPATAAPP